MKISIVIPIFNEEGNIKPLYEKLKEQSGYEWEAILINDGSSDQSFPLMKEISAQDERIKIIDFRKNYGQTTALSAGFDFASGEVIIPMDGDLQNDPENIPQLLEKINQGYDVVSGWRKDRKDPFFSRRLPSILANTLISKITKIKLHDYGCSLKAYRKAILKDVRLYGEMHRFIPAYAAWHGASVTEVVVTHYSRHQGKSKYGLGRTFKVVLDLLTVKFLTNYLTKPMHFFGSIAIGCVFVSFASAFLAFYFKFTGEKTLIQTPLPLFSAFFFMIAIQFLLMGLIAEMLTRIYYEGMGKPIYIIKEKINL
ncbi:MAG: glycosyltransferase family 2 protein [Planctomycetota bacterium]